MLIRDSRPPKYKIIDDIEIFEAGYNSLLKRFPRLDDQYENILWQFIRDPFSASLQQCKAFPGEGREFYVHLTPPIAGEFPTPSFRLLIEIERHTEETQGRAIMWRIQEDRFLAIM